MSRVRKQYNSRELADLMRNVCYKLRKLREEQEISQSELSRRSSVSQSTINDLENGVSTDLQLSTLCLLSKALKVRVVDFFSSTDLDLSDPDRREFLKAMEDVEKGFRVMERLKRRVGKS